MKKLFYFFISSLLAVGSFAQSVTIDPNFIQIPKVNTLNSCVVTDKGKTVFNNSDNKMYYCNGTAWQAMADNSITTPPNTNAGYGNWNECIMPNITDYQPQTIQEGESYARYNFTISADWVVVHVARPSNSTIHARLIFYKLNGNSWEHYQTITESAASYGYGEVDIFNNILIVGDNNANHFYEFDGNTWFLKQTINSTSLGNGVSINNGVAISSQNNNFSILSNQFVNNEWQIVFQETLFGNFNNISEVDISGDFAVVTTSSKVIIFQDQYLGAQYTFNLLQEISYNTAASISILGYNLLIGQEFYNGYDNNFNQVIQSGQATLYQYKNGTFVPTHFFSDQNPNEKEHFGSCVKLSGDYLLIGAYGKTNVPYGYSKGAYFLYKKQQNKYIKIETIFNPAYLNAALGQRCDIDGVSKRFVLNTFEKELIFGKVKF